MDGTAFGEFIDQWAEHGVDQVVGGVEGGEGGAGEGSASAAGNTANGGKGGTDSSGESSSGDGSFSVKPSLCWENTSEANLYVGLASFVMGAFVTAMLSMWVNRGFSFSPRPPRQQQIPSGDDDEGAIEEPPDDELL